MQTLKSLMRDISKPVVIFTDSERDDYACINGLNTQYTLEINNRLYIQTCYPAPKTPADEKTELLIRHKKEEAFTALTGLVPSDKYGAEMGEFKAENIVRFITERKSPPILVIIAPLFNNMLQNIVSSLPQECLPLTVITYTGQYNMRHNHAIFTEYLNQKIIGLFYDFNKFLFFGKGEAPAELRDWYELNPLEFEWSIHIVSSNDLEKLYDMLRVFNSAHLRPSRLFGENYNRLEAHEQHFLNEIYETDLTRYCKHVAADEKLIQFAGKKKSMARAPHMAAAIADDIIPLAFDIPVDEVFGDWTLTTVNGDTFSTVVPNENGTGNAYQFTARKPLNVASIREFLWVYLYSKLE